MSLSKERMEKELAAQKYRAEKIEKEALAQKKKAEAIAHLESQGQRVEGVIGFSKKLEPKTSDNTLSMLLTRKAITTAVEGEKLKEQQSKAALIRQQEDNRRSRELKIENDSLPPSWQSVFDNCSNSYYYWNKTTNVTSWIKPEVESDTPQADAIEDVSKLISNKTVVPPTTDLLLCGWQEKKHPATQQSYYINLTSLETRSIKPTLENMNNSSTALSNTAPDVSSNKRSSIGTQNRESAKFRKFAIDPLDFEAQQGDGNKRNGRTIDKMADSTASGPLWQQRPYPAPGTIMRAKETSVANVGPISRQPTNHSGHYGPSR